MRPVVHGHANDVDVFLDDRGRDRLGRLAEPCEDDLEAVVPQHAGDDAQSPVVPVEADLCQQHPDGSGAAGTGGTLCGAAGHTKERSNQMPNTVSRARIASPTVT